MKLPIKLRFKSKSITDVPFKEDSKKNRSIFAEDKGQVGRVRAARLMQFANENTLVVGPYYRVSNGSEGRDEFANADLKDVTYLIKILKQRFPNAYIHMIGFSRGNTRTTYISRLPSR